MSTIKMALATAGVLKHVILSSAIDGILSSAEIVEGPEDLGEGISQGKVQLKPDVNKSPIEGFDLALSLPPVIKPTPYKLKIEPTAFLFWMVIGEQEEMQFAFTFARGVPGLALTGAQQTVAPDGTVSLEKFPDDDPRSQPQLVCRSNEPGAKPGPALLISGSADAPAGMRFAIDTDSTDGVIQFGLVPSTVVFGGSGMGFDCPALVLDDSIQNAAAGQGAPGLDPPLENIPADAAAWRGLLARELDFFLPAGVPLFGGRVIKAYLAVPFGPGGARLIVESRAPPRPEAPGRPALPGYSIRIECQDSAAVGLAGLVPTLITATMELPLDEARAEFADGAAQSLTFSAGKPLLLTATLSRDPGKDPQDFKLVLGVSAQGPQGLVAVDGAASTGAKIFNTAAAMATALIADKDVAREADVGDGKGVVLAGLLASGGALTSLFENDSRFVLHGAEIESTGHGAPVGGVVALKLDYSVAVRVTKVNIGVLQVQMNPHRPMRIRVRDVRMSVDPGRSGLEMIGLDFDRAAMEIEDPGAWKVEGLDQLFDVLGSRSGRGSSWIEVDLRFKLNLGPISVSGATIRATLQADGTISGAIRGLEAGMSIPAALKGQGSIHLQDGGFSADLKADLIPLNVAADAGIIYAPPLVVLSLDVDFPGPLPLANTGFGLFGIGGVVGFSAVPDFGAADDPDPILRQLKWNPHDEHAFRHGRGQSTFGLSAVVGTLPDLGFSFSAKAGVMITVPDIAVRGALNGKVLQPPVKMTDRSEEVSAGVSFLGFVAVDAAALSFGVLGSVKLGPLLRANVPLAGRFPLAKADRDDWYLYLGADGAPVQDRSIGPISVRILPDILDSGADAYVMIRGRGLSQWPFGRSVAPLPDRTDGFVVAFGFALQETFGVKPIVWAELYASLDLLIGAKPPTLAGFGRAGGSLNLGPFSLGVEARVSFMIQEGATHLWAEVTGRIELFFFDIEGTVTISFGAEPTLTLPPPDRHPLDRLDEAGRRAGVLGSLTDDTYRVVAPLVEDPAAIRDDMHVWPDAMVSLPFAITPSINGAFAAAQFPAIAGAPPPPARIGSTMLHYAWRLDRLEFVDVTDEADPVKGPGTRPAGQLASRWQTSRGGVDNVAEIILFSTSADLWINRLADGGADVLGDPLRQAAELCRHNVVPIPGWAVGYFAGKDTSGLYVPPEPVSADPLFSRVEAHVRHFGINIERQVTALDGVHTLPEPFSLVGARLEVWEPPGRLEREFPGYLVAPDLHWLDGRNPRELLREAAAFAGQRIALALREPVLDAQLVLVGPRELFEIREDFIGLRVFDDQDLEWTNPDFADVPSGGIAAIFRGPAGREIRGLVVNYPVAQPLGIVGIAGVTLSARDVAAARNRANEDEVARLAAKADIGPKTDPDAVGPHERVILRPGRLYRIDIDMAWLGELAQSDESGSTTIVKTVGFDDPEAKNYAPAGVSTSTARKLFFRTVAKPEAHAPLPPGNVGFAKWLRQRQDVFQPEMLTRYLAGYDPGQSESFRFCDDPLRVHFVQDHVSALAKAYGFDLRVAVRRVDRPGAAFASPLLLMPSWTFITDPAFLSATDKIRFKLAKASPCMVPSPGATATVNTPLDPEALYEINVLAKSDDRAFEDGTLPGVTFHTSRWRTPDEMLTGLGLTVAGGPEGLPPVTGDIAIPSPAGLGPPVILGDDRGFLAALAALGLEGWPVAEAPRLSHFWMEGADGAWLYAGTLFESPEPIHRPGRLDVRDLAVEMGPAGAGIQFDIRRRDRSGSRILFLTSTPFRVVSRRRRLGADDRPPFGIGRHRPQARAIGHRLVLNATSTLNGAATDLAGSIRLPGAPGFSGDP